MRGFRIQTQEQILAAEFPKPMNMFSWSLTRPGFAVANSVAWLEVKNADLPIGRDPAQHMMGRLTAAGYGESVQMMTARNIDKYHVAHAESGDVYACCLATVGLGNAGRVGDEPSRTYGPGTINFLVHVNKALSPGAYIEAITIAASARTAAIMELRLEVGGKNATGTGTDCIVLSAPIAFAERLDVAVYAGLHTDIGAAIGAAVYEAVHQGGLQWMAEQAAK